MFQSSLASEPRTQLPISLLFQLCEQLNSSNKQNKQHGGCMYNIPIERRSGCSPEIHSGVFPDPYSPAFSHKILIKYKYQRSFVGKCEVTACRWVLKTPVVIIRGQYASHYQDHSLVHLCVSKVNEGGLCVAICPRAITLLANLTAVGEIKTDGKLNKMNTCAVKFTPQPAFNLFC